MKSSRSTYCDPGTTANGTEHSRSCTDFDVIFIKYYDALVRFGIRFSVKAEQAEEFASDAMLKLWDRFDRFEHYMQMKAFLYTSVKFACLNSVRNNRSKRQVGIEALGDPVSQEDNIVQRMIKADLLREINAAIKTLPPQCLLIFESLFFDEHDARQTADNLNVAVSTIRNQKARGLSLLRKRINLT